MNGSEGEIVIAQGGGMRPPRTPWAGVTPRDLLMVEALRPRNFAVTLCEAVLTGVVAVLVVSLGMQIWIMFVGWIAYFTRGIDWRNGLVNAGSVCVGLLLGMGIATTFAMLGRPPQPPELFVIMTGVSLFVLSSRFLPVFNNLLSVFLGVVTWFAAHEQVGAGTYSWLAANVAIGSLAGFLAHVMQQAVVARFRSASDL